MPLTMENARRLLEQDHDVTEVTQGGNVMGGYLEARLTDGRAVQVDFHDNPAWKDTDRLAGRIEVSYANRPQAEWRYDDNDMAEREHTVIDPAAPDALQELGKAVEGWERAGGLRTARASETSHLAAQQPPEEYAYRWRKPGDPDRHIAYLSTAFDRDQAMKAREDAGYLVTKVDEDPAILYERHRKASCMRASHILERYDSPDQDAVRILHSIVGEVNAHDPENDIAAYLTYPSDKAVQIAGDGLTAANIAEKREMGGWDPRKDPLMRINVQGDWAGVTQQQADQLVWDNRDEILARASYDSELSTWTLHQLDQLKEPQQEQPAQDARTDRIHNEASRAKTVDPLQPRGGALPRRPAFIPYEGAEDTHDNRNKRPAGTRHLVRGHTHQQPTTKRRRGRLAARDHGRGNHHEENHPPRQRQGAFGEHPRPRAQGIPSHGQRRRGRRRIRHRHRGHKPRVRSQP